MKIGLTHLSCIFLLFGVVQSKFMAILSVYRFVLCPCKSFLSIQQRHFDTINHEILSTKLELYGFTDNSLNLSRNYRSNRTPGYTDRQWNFRNMLGFQLDQFYSSRIYMGFLLLQANIRYENVLQTILISLFRLKTLEYCFHPSLMNFAIWNYCLIQIIEWRVMSVYKDEA